MPGASRVEIPLLSRPDGRVFARLKGLDPATAAVGLSQLITQREQPIYVNCDLADEDLVVTCRRLGMKSEMVATTYRVPFEGALARSSGKSRPLDYDLVPADQVEADRLYALDIELRQDVPGIDGWAGNREWFDDELASDEFDATGYLVARHKATGNLTGLIRFWRKAGDPALGLLGVLPAHRNGYMSMALWRQGMLGASGWGSTHFTTNTARPALQRRLVRAGGTIVGRFAQMVTAG